MTDFSIGGRKGKGCRNHLFIINGIIHDVLRSVKNKSITIQIYDFTQMFDSVSLKEAICDMYEVGVKNENLNLLYEANKKIYMAVKTHYGLSDRTMIESSILQGDTWAPSFASVQTDSIIKDDMDSNIGYKYKGVLQMAPLGMTDDLLGFTLSGPEFYKLN